MTLSSPELIPIARSQRNKAADILSSAFQHDPFVSWVFPTKKLRIALCQLLVRLHADQGHAEMTREENGVILWSLSENRVKFWKAPREIFTLFLAGGFSIWRQLNQFFNDPQFIHPAEPHLYISMIGVSADAKGQGVGKRMLHAILAKGDEAQLPIFLENSNEKNLKFYQSFGFEVMGDNQPPKSGVPPTWRMLRQPQSVSVSEGQQLQ